MIKTLEQKIQAEAQITRLEDAIMALKSQLLPDRKKQYEIMASGYVSKLVELREEIDAFTGVALLVSPDSDINIHLVGRAIGYGCAPISLISRYLDNFKKSLQTIHSAIAGISYKTKLPREIISASDFSLIALRQGSLNISLKRPVQQLNFFDNNYDLSIKTYFEIMHWASNDQDDEISLNDSIKDRALLSVVRTLPDSKNIREITFSGQVLKDFGEIRVNSASKEKILKSFKKPSDEKKLVTRQGRIREVDLDRNSFILREIIDSEDTDEIKCTMSDSVAELLKDYLDTFVMITGFQDKQNSIFVTLIENADS